MRSESQGSLYASQAARSYLRFPTTASACADWYSVLVMHESVLRLNLYMLKLCAEEMCFNSCVYYNATVQMPGYWSECQDCTRCPNFILGICILVQASVYWLACLDITLGVHM